MTISRKLLATLGVVSVVAAGAAIPAIAQDTTDEATTEDATDVADSREELRAAHAQDFAEALAAELGLDADTVADAVEAVREDMQATRRAEMQERRQARLDEMVESGELTQDEADTLAEIQDRGGFGGMGPFGRGGRSGHGPRFQGPSDRF